MDTNNVKHIPLGNGYTAIVDADQYDKLKYTAWHTVTKRKYAATTIRTKGSRKSSTVYMHRLLTGALPGDHVDHINGNNLDNRLCNLRLCSPAENLRNQRISPKNTSGYKGVFWHKAAGKWMASVKYNYKAVYLGLFKTKEQAALAYNEAAKRLHGEFALLNVIPTQELNGI